MRPVTLNLNGIQDPQVSAALMEIQRASQDTLQNDTSSSGSAMATLTGAAADQMVYFTSATTTAYTSLTSFGRSVIGAVSAAASLTLLGVSAFMQTLLVAIDAPAAMTTLGFSAFFQTLIGAANAAAFRTLIGAGTGNGNGNGTVTNVATTGLASGGPITTTGTIAVTAATQSDQQTGSSTTTVVTPAHAQDHDGAAKAWVMFDNISGTITIRASYNVASVVRNGTGDVTVTFTVAFATANYVCVTTLGTPNADGSIDTQSSIKAQVAGSVRINASVANTALDRGMSVVCFGRQ